MAREGKRGTGELSCAYARHSMADAFSRGIQGRRPVAFFWKELSELCLQQLFFFFFFFVIHILTLFYSLFISYHIFFGSVGMFSSTFFFIYLILFHFMLHRSKFFSNVIAFFFFAEISSKNEYVIRHGIKTKQKL